MHTDIRSKIVLLEYYLIIYILIYTNEPEVKSLFEAANIGKDNRLGLAINQVNPLLISRVEELSSII
jgi:hypothetical protein